MKRLCLSVCLCLLVAPLSWSAEVKVEKGDRIVIVGNSFAERMLYTGHFETLVYSQFPDYDLVIRNLGWSADELTLRPRSKDFQDHGHKLTDHKPDILIACFGFNESFGGEKGLPQFNKDLEAFIRTSTTTKYNGEKPPKLVLVSPIAQEDITKVRPHVRPDVEKNNANLRLYSEAMGRIAAREGIAFVDLFTASQRLFLESKTPLTSNSIHLTEKGYAKIAMSMYLDMFGPPRRRAEDLSKLRAAVNEKNLQFYYDYRAVNGYYIYGGRKKPFGVVNFPAEFAKLRKMIANRDKRIWAIAQGKKVPEKIDDSNTGDFVKVATNFKGKVTITPPEEAVKSFTLPEGYVIELFASEKDFSELENPVQFAFDTKGRLWVTTMESYPQYLPGTPPNDKVLILEDSNSDGKADKCSVFADGLHVPTGIELGDGGAYVAQQPNLVFLKDTDGDGKADFRRRVLLGFDSADSHHSISAFEWGPGGALYFQEGTFHHTQVETPHGPERVKDAAVFRYEPKTEKFGIFVSYRFANPWGHVFDRWGQNFVADASGGANYFGTAFSGDVLYGQKHPTMNQFLKKQWRPTAGCEIVSSRNFPDDVQGNYLLNNCIGFLGTLQYKFKDAGSGFEATPVEPLLRSSDPNFRPVDLQFGPDGALYICDWFNPLIGHMQHSLRDPNRDKNHGRIWRIRYKGRPLVKPAKIDGQPIPALLELLKSYEDRTRYRVRRELRNRDEKEVAKALEKWVAGLDKKAKGYQHHLLEALWVYQHLDIVEEGLLKRLLRADDARVRAAATRVLCYWRDEVEKPLKLLEAQVNDAHPRVRLEAVRALSFFDSPEAQETALLSLAHDQDYYLEYTLKETLATLDRKIKAKK